MLENKLRKHTMLVTALLLIVVFIAGLIMGKATSNVRMNDLDRYMLENELNTESFLIEQELIGSLGDNCALSGKRLNDLISEQVKIGRLLSAEDAKETLGEEDYRFLKKKYHLMQIRTYIMYKNQIENCNESHHVILYYFGAKDPNSLEQGHILDRIVEEKGSVYVFAIEFNYSKELVFLESSYGIYETPSLVVDYDKTLAGLKSYDDITAALAARKD